VEGSCDCGGHDGKGQMGEGDQRDRGCGRYGGGGGKSNIFSRVMLGTLLLK
jgi:hypothetical protein